MEKKRSVGIDLYSLLGFCVGAHALYTAYKHKFWGGLEWAYWVIGPVYSILSLGIFMLINRVRITLVVVSSIVASLFIVIPAFLFLLRPDNWQWGILSFTLFFPVFLLSIYSLIYLTRPKVKEQFK